MRKTGALLVLLPILFVFLGGQRCVLEPDREFIYESDTTIVVDTLRIHDTTLVRDTIIHIDTIRVHDTTKVYDTLWRHDTLWIHDTTYVYRDTLRLHDTTTVHDTIVHIDTLRIHDTTRVHDTLIHTDTLRVHDTTRVHDTVAVHDTLRTFAVATTSDQLFGVWEGIVVGKYIRLSITRPVQYSSYALMFDCNVATAVYEGHFGVVSGNIASSGWVSGPSAYGESATWVFSITNNVLTLQQSGFQMFPTMQSFTLRRIQ